MKKLMITTAAIAALTLASPAFAHGFSIGPGGVQLGESGGHDEHHDHGWHDHHGDWEHHHHHDHDEGGWHHHYHHHHDHDEGDGDGD